MSTTFRPYNPDQLLLLPPNMAEWLPKDHLAHFINETVEELDTEAFYERYEGDGRRNCPYEPKMLLKVLIYGYATGVFSSRQIAKKAEEDVAFRILSANNFPNFRTINRFRKDNVDKFIELFTQVVMIAREAGLVKLGTLAVDGTKVKANASKHKAMSYERMKEEEKRIRKEIRELTQRARRADAREDQKYGADKRGDEIPEELKRRESRLEVIRAAKKRLEAQQEQADRDAGRDEDDDDKPSGASSQGGKPKRPFGEPKPKAQTNFTDPESRIMKTGSGFQL